MQLEKKGSEAISDELKNIYVEHGPLRVIQSNQGGEFKCAVKGLCRRMNIKLMYSRPFHPQSQGKVERSHRSLGSKIEYDFFKMGRKGVNWTVNLSNYQRISNGRPKRGIRIQDTF